MSVDLDAIQPIRDIVVQDLLLAKQGSISLEITDDASVLRYGMSLRHLPGNEDGFTRFVSVALLHHALGWSLVSRVKSFNLSENRHASKWSHYRFETAGDDVLQASQEVFQIRARVDMEINDGGEPIEAVDKQYLTFARPMQTEDCERLLGILERAARRAKVA